MSTSEIIALVSVCIAFIGLVSTICALIYTVKNSKRVDAKDLAEKIKAAGADIIAVDALSLAEQAGTAKASNVVLMGVFAATTDYSDDLWQKALEQCVPPKFLELNKKAFELGKNAK